MCDVVTGTATNLMRTYTFSITNGLCVWMLTLVIFSKSVNRNNWADHTKNLTDNNKFLWSEVARNKGTQFI